MSESAPEATEDNVEANIDTRWGQAKSQSQEEKEATLATLEKTEGEIKVIKEAMAENPNIDNEAVVASYREQIEVLEKEAAAAMQLEEVPTEYIYEKYKSLLQEEIAAEEE
jgi:t-SNARE complex subunit (syntaxin)